MGANGAVLCTVDSAWYCPALQIQALGVQGAGDSMVAGLLYGLYNSYPQSEYLPIAMAAATASVSLAGTQMCTLEGFKNMLASFPFAQLHSIID